MSDTLTTKTVEHGGATIEVAACGREWCVTIDGVEKTRTKDGEHVPFYSAHEAMDWARRRVTARNRRTTGRTIRRAEPDEDARQRAVDQDRRAFWLRSMRWAARFEQEFGWWPGCVGEKPADLDAILGDDR